MNVRTNLLLPEDLVAAIDEIAGPRGRSRYVAEAMEQHVRRDRWYTTMRAASGAWRDHPLFPTDDSVVAWIRAGRRDSRDPWADDAES